ncbi:DUF2711 family protein [Bacillus sp. PK3_68]|uniref:DUF2711 family protein n=1 Tax=Bacillus sp. PK3_68 TaxID=2027408 RepID=UPI0016003FCA|nr:DUF2711 family protein [Bacillus sp. PK3_68]
MIDYISLDINIPILRQLPPPFASAAILFHPFVQMSAGWKQAQQKYPNHHVYPDDREIIELGSPVSWKKIMQQSGLSSFAEVATALSDNWLDRKYAKPHLAKKLDAALHEDLFWPMEDTVCILLLKDILDTFSSKGAEYFYYADPIEGKKGRVRITDITPFELPFLTLSEMIIADENMDFAFMSEYDAYTTYFFAKDENIHTIIKQKEWEALICDKETTSAWFLSE